TQVVQVGAALRRLGLSATYVLNSEKLATQKTGAQMNAGAKAGAAHALVVLGGDAGEIRRLSGDALARGVDLTLLTRSRDRDDYLAKFEPSIGSADDYLASLLRGAPDHRGANDRP
ncbi:MAG: hypothetical protein ACLGIK_13350, partial [Gemmatimonadota bacterium]